MALREVYQWQTEMQNALVGVNKWAIRALAELSYGVMASESCQSRKVARYLSRSGVKIDSIERRWQRFLANDNIEMEAYFGVWSRWVVAATGVAKAYLLVDETKLGDQVGALVVGLAYRQRCIPLAWRIYRANSASGYPAEGQVGVIRGLLEAIQAGLPADLPVVVLADRGIGTSSKLCETVAALGWHYLFRVTASTTIRVEEGQVCKIAAQVQAGEYWHETGEIFASAACLPAHAIALQHPTASQPWALVTNDETLTGWEYAYRNWQEQSFRDLKSHGWHWHTSRVTDPHHVSRLWLILVLAYARILACGAAHLAAGLGIRPKRDRTLPVRPRLSLFRQGLEAFQLLCARLPVLFPPLLLPPP